jgi:hypothetical protein
LLKLSPIQPDLARHISGTAIRQKGDHPAGCGEGPVEAVTNLEAAL